MSRLLIFIILLLALVVSCTSDTRIPLDESMATLREAGYLLSMMSTTDMRCFQGMNKDGVRIVFMQVYCTIEDQIDMMNFGINPNYSSEGEEKIRKVLEIVGFSRAVEVLDFYSKDKNRLNQGIQVEGTIGAWKISASTSEGGGEEIFFVSIFSARYLEEVAN